MSYSKESCATRKVADFETCKEPGDFYIIVANPKYYGPETHMMGLRLPDGTFNNLPMRKGPPPSGAVWGWDGNEDSPTLAPSIDCKERWHGHLVAGRLQSC
jgi:hypothetical protein